ncbi:MAG: Eco57I restriction-modification methylase domain-containing protein, partial [Methanoregula sp.]|nr:Eco57I restriction-modification methylase domain-containing protein [Methanoregula sp.]
MTSTVSKNQEDITPYLYPAKNPDFQNLVGYANNQTKRYCEANPVSDRKPKGQIFTPPKIASFMAGLFASQKNTIRILDPGAGTGILVAAVCDRLIQENRQNLEISVHVYENDKNVLPFLKSTLEACRNALNEANCSMEYQIFENDFILHHAKVKQSGKYIVYSLDLSTRYDLVISNPPYYKLNKSSPEALALEKYVYGQPNIYAFFMLLSGMLLGENGEMVFITPRSFCSGLYYSKIRRWFVHTLTLDRLHLFETRKDVFVDDQILQENLIFHATNVQPKPDGKTLISVSYDRQFTQYQELTVPSSDVAFCRGVDCYIRIPISKNDLKVIEIVDSWPETLNSLGFEISTGPVVDFRALKYLRSTIENSQCVPLLWMHNIRGINVEWSIGKNGKARAIEITPGSKNLVVPMRNYVLLKRFTSKEQKKRVHAAVMDAGRFPDFEFVGLENHLNYIRKKRALMTLDEAYGIAAVMNTTIIDQYFRALNGNTQVNATDVRVVPMPEYEKIVAIGKLIRKKNPDSKFDCDDVISKVLNIEKHLVKNEIA